MDECWKCLDKGYHWSCLEYGCDEWGCNEFYPCDCPKGVEYENA